MTFYEKLFMSGFFESPILFHIFSSIEDQIESDWNVERSAKYLSEKAHEKNTFLSHGYVSL